MSLHVRGYGRFGVEPDGGIPHVDGFPLLSTEGFWPAYFLSQGIEDEDIVFGVFEGAEDDALEVHRSMKREDAWPTFRIPLGNDGALVIVFRNLEDDDGVDYVVDPGRGKDCIRIAAVEGHFMGPGISWGELESISDAAGGSHEKAQRLLLLAPMYSDAHNTDRAAREFSWAFDHVGATGDPNDLALLLAKGGTMWGEPEWFMGEDGAWTCEGELSYRNPGGYDPLDLSSRIEVDNVLRLNLP